MSHLHVPIQLVTAQICQANWDDASIDGHLACADPPATTPPVIWRGKPVAGGVHQALWSRLWAEIPGLLSSPDQSIWSGRERRPDCETPSLLAPLASNNRPPCLWWPQLAGRLADGLSSRPASIS